MGLVVCFVCCVVWVGREERGKRSSKGKKKGVSQAKLKLKR